MSELNKGVIVSGVRLPVGSYGGSLKGMPAIDMGAMVVKEAVRRAGIDTALVDEVIIGQVGGPTTEGRAADYPDYPTMAELGYPDVVNLSQTYFYLPAGSDAALEQAVNAAFSGIADDATVKENLAAMQARPVYMTLDEVQKSVEENLASLKKGFAAAGFDVSGKK